MPTNNSLPYFGIIGSLNCSIKIVSKTFVLVIIDGLAVFKDLATRIIILKSQTSTLCCRQEQHKAKEKVYFIFCSHHETVLLFSNRTRCLFHSGQYNEIEKSLSINVLPTCVHLTVHLICLRSFDCPECQLVLSILTGSGNLQGFGQGIVVEFRYTGPLL